jgi:hypothetical protein
MKLSPEEMHFLRHWMYEEMHYQGGGGLAKQLQLTHHAVSAHLAVIIAAAIPDLAEQWAAGVGPPPAGQPTWPWSQAPIAARLAEARALLDSRGGRQNGKGDAARLASEPIGDTTVPPDVQE